jgi:hypothetical protein
MALIVVIAGLIGMRYAKMMITDFTDNKAAPLPVSQMPPAEMEKVQARVDAFREDLRAKRPTQPLTLTADEINALITTEPDLRPLKDKLYVTIDGNQLKGQVSVPMDEVGLPVFKGRYLNGTGTFNLALRNGLLRLTAESIVVKGKPVPDVYMQKIRTQNLVRNINSDPRASIALGHFQDIEVKDGKLVLVPKQ